MNGKILQRMLVFASLALLSSAAAAQITNTPHNLTSAAGGAPSTTADTDQICVFCHTPHGSNTDVAAPLWNKAIPNTTYDVYNSTSATATSTIDGEILEVGSVSLACLSCHDGTQAMDNMFNAPGSGPGEGTGAEGENQLYTWTAGNKVTGIANLGVDLTNDHPIGIQYCGGGVTGATNEVSGTCNDLDFHGPGGTGTEERLRTANINSQQVFWVSTQETPDNIRRSTDMILYTRAFTGGAGPSVECASCHDPHKTALSTGSDVNFMRVSTAGSAICLACHVK